MSNIINQINQLDIHKEIKEKLQYFLDNNKIPNIIFYGPSGCGKKTLVFDFISSVYNNDKSLLKSYVMYANCAQGKGIKFIREELKFFAKTHINLQGSCHFKTVILSNADQLTIDAQSALRRCIELFSHSTRFFVIVEDKYKLLKPILSRFCEIYIQYPKIKKNNINLHEYHLEKCFSKDKTKYKMDLIRKLIDVSPPKTTAEIMCISETLYEKGISGLDLIDYIRSREMENKKKYQLILFFQSVKKDFRNEKIFMTFILNFLFIRYNVDLENVSFM